LIACIFLLDSSQVSSKVLGASQKARSLGVKEGMPLKSEQNYDQVIRVLEWFSPRIESAPPSLTYLDMGVFKGDGTELQEAFRLQGIEKKC
jgi:hypothetical protein